MQHRLLHPRIRGGLIAHHHLISPRSACGPSRRLVVSNSIDPWANRATFEKGFVFTINTEEKLQAFLDEHRDTMVVLMCKSSHCK